LTHTSKHLQRCAQKLSRTLMQLQQPETALAPLQVQKILQLVRNLPLLSLLLLLNERSLVATAQSRKVVAGTIAVAVVVQYVHNHLTKHKNTV
jgi:hypothetical protein